MLKIKLSSFDVWDENRMEFVTFDETTVLLEHSLVSVSKWESIWKVPFLTGAEKTPEQVLSYFECMVLEPDPEEIHFSSRINDQHVGEISKYIDDPMTASWVSGDSTPSREIITSELIYHWLISAQIPFDVEKWHLNRLMMLLRITSEKNKPQKKANSREFLERQRALNEARRKAMGTSG